ncbi:MAG: hypothetical protein M3O33_16740 [Cyanobacteriota bacterium]|nr:hypothetical protein [Cyanobacteriota bacterium]
MAAKTARRRSQRWILANSSGEISRIGTFIPASAARERTVSTKSLPRALTQ